MHTIFASTNKTISAIKIIRITGSNAKKVPEIFDFKCPKPKSFQLRKLNYQKRLIDNAIVCWLPGPKTVTGEDVFELHVHGSLIIEELIYEALLSEKNFRIAENGEFTKRAFLNGVLDLTQAEAVNDLVNSETKKQLDLANSILEGNLKSKIFDWRESIISIMSTIEVLIDFSDEDIPDNLEISINEKIHYLINEIEKAIKNSKYSISIRSGFIVTITGKTNVGKSSLMNAILKKNASIVTEIPGTTRDIIEQKINVNGFPVYLNDTAGLRKTDSLIEHVGIEKAKKLISQSDIILNLSENDDFNLPFSISKKKLVNVRSKSDLNVNKFKNEDIYVSTKYNIGIENLLKHVSMILKKIQPKESSLLVNKRQVNSLMRALKSLKRIRNLSFEHEAELIAEELRLSLNAVSSVSMVVDFEEILDEIFKNFCIGK